MVNRYFSTSVCALLGCEGAFYAWILLGENSFVCCTWEGYVVVVLVSGATGDLVRCHSGGFRCVVLFQYPYGDGCPLSPLEFIRQ